MSLAFKMLQVWQMLRSAKWLITGREKAQDEVISPMLSKKKKKQNEKGRDRGKLHCTILIFQFLSIYILAD